MDKNVLDVILELLDASNLLLAKGVRTSAAESNSRVNEAVHAAANGQKRLLNIGDSVGVGRATGPRFYRRN